MNKVANVGAAHFNAEAGKSYFFRVQNTFNFDKDASPVDNGEFKQIDPDQGEALASQFKFATSHPK